MPDEIKKINLRSEKDKPLKIKAEDIETLVPEKILSQWMDGDADPYFKIQEIKYPLLANGYNYVESFFESFIEKLNRAPIPGSKDGHLMEWGKRADTDFILVGAKIDKKKNGKGSVFFKNYIPPEGESGSNEVFLKELKSNMIDFSLVAYTKDERIENEDGSIIWNVIESVGGERNDAVPYGLGAMEQKTNKSINDGKNNINGESKQMNKEEVLKALKTLKTNAEVTLPEVAKAMGLEKLLITDEQQTALSKLNVVQGVIGEKIDILDFVTESMKYRKENARITREAKMNEVFGPKVFENTKKENKARVYAERILKDDELTDEKVNEIKDDEFYKGFVAENADINSDANEVEGISEGNKKNIKKDAETAETGIRVKQM